MSEISFLVCPFLQNIIDRSSLLVINISNHIYYSQSPKIEENLAAQAPFTDTLAAATYIDSRN